MPIPPFPPAKPIVLVGLPGAGKTSNGQRLADRLGLRFFDSDAEAERAAGLSVADLFRTRGETWFRAEERRTMARLAGESRCVIAAGGGAFVDPATRSLLLSATLTVWLKARPQTLAARLAAGPERPLLAGRNPLEALAALEAERRAFYAQAHLHVCAEEADVADRIVDALRAAA